MNSDIIIAHILNGFLCVDRDWVVRKSNTRASTMLRKPTAQVEGASLWDVFRDSRRRSEGIGHDRHG